MLILVIFTLFWRHGKTAKSDFFTNFDDKNHYEGMVIQTNPFGYRQIDTQTVSTKKSERNSKYKCLFRQVEVGSYPPVDVFTSLAKPALLPRVFCGLPVFAMLPDFLGQFKGLKKANSKLCQYVLIGLSAPDTSIEYWVILNKTQSPRRTIERPTKITWTVALKVPLFVKSVKETGISCFQC